MQCRALQLDPAINRHRPVVLLGFIDLRETQGLQQAIVALRGELPNAPLIGVDNAATKAIECKVAGVDHWLTYRNGADLIHQLRQVRPGAICIVYRTGKPKGHLKLEGVAALSGAHCYLASFSPNHLKLQEFGRGRLIGRIALKSFLLLLRAGAAGALAGYVAGVLLATQLFGRASERPSEPPAGQKQ